MVTSAAGKRIGSRLAPCPDARRSDLLGRYNDHSRVFRQFHCGIEGPHHAILHNTRHGQRAATGTKMILQWRRHGIRRQI
jgi:hypothetical protein